MELKTDKKILNEAINSGCKTAGEFALYLKMRDTLQAVLKGINQ